MTAGRILTAAAVFAVAWLWVAVLAPIPAILECPALTETCAELMREHWTGN